MLYFASSALRASGPNPFSSCSALSQLRSEKVVFHFLAPWQSRKLGAATKDNNLDHLAAAPRATRSRWGMSSNLLQPSLNVPLATAVPPAWQARALGACRIGEAESGEREKEAEIGSNFVQNAPLQLGSECFGANFCCLTASGGGHRERGADPTHDIVHSDLLSTSQEKDDESGAETDRACSRGHGACAYFGGASGTALLVVDASGSLRHHFWVGRGDHGGLQDDGHHPR
eukprot:scaffold3144_cov260-Pinguiococcus_pyrenoidosus.AAC.2